MGKLQFLSYLMASALTSLYFHSSLSYLFHRSSSQVITELDILGVIVECKSWKDSTAMILSVISGRLVYPHNGKEILTMKRVCVLILCYTYAILLIIANI